VALDAGDESEVIEKDDSEAVIGPDIAAHNRLLDQPLDHLPRGKLFGFSGDAWGRVHEHPHERGSRV
jgi:hypothetical protein